MQWYVQALYTPPAALTGGMQAAADSTPLLCACRHTATHPIAAPIPSCRSRRKEAQLLPEQYTAACFPYVVSFSSAVSYLPPFLTNQGSPLLPLRRAISGGWGPSSFIRLPFNQSDKAFRCLCYLCLPDTLLFPVGFCLRLFQIFIPIHMPVPTAICRSKL